MSDCILRLPQVMARTGLKKATLYAKSNPKHVSYDPAFPHAIPLGIRSVGWLASEVDAWVESRIALRKV